MLHNPTTFRILLLKMLLQNLTTRYSQNASTGSTLLKQKQNSQESKDKTKKTQNISQTKYTLYIETYKYNKNWKEFLI